jgi:hypothetical protein
MLERDLSGLPGPNRDPEHGWKPDRAPRFASVLAETWMRDRLAEGPRPRAVSDKRFRHSDAGNCARAVAYAALDLPASNPMDIAGFWATGMGTLLHEQLQAALKSRYPGIEDEVVCIIDGFEGSGHADLAVGLTLGAGPDAQHYNPGQRVKVVVEVKTVGGYAYKLAVGERGQAKGPSWSYVVQGALNAKALGADELVIALLARDVISVQAAQRGGFDELTRFCAEWTLTREEYEPIAATEIERVSGILGLLDKGMLPRRTIPDPELPRRNLITDPARGTWVEVDGDGNMTDAGSTWHCAYCKWMDTCATTGPGRVPITEVSIG